MIDGRLSHSTISHVHHGVGALNSAPGVHLRNGGLLTLVEWDFEGNAEDPELWIDSCTEVAGLHIQVSPTERGPGCGIRVTNSSFVRITGHAAISGYASFSQFGGRLLSIDEQSDHCRFDAIGGQTAFDKEIEWRSPGTKGNYIEYVDVPSGNTRTVRDENAAGQPSLRVTAALTAVTVGPRRTETQTVNVPGAKPGAEILIGRRPAERGDMTPEMVFTGYVEQLNAVSVVLSNPTDAPVRVPTGQISIRVFNP
jgi:hypothetical protein